MHFLVRWFTRNTHNGPEDYRDGVWRVAQMLCGSGDGRPCRDHIGFAVAAYAEFRMGQDRERKAEADLLEQVNSVAMAERGPKENR